MKQANVNDTVKVHYTGTLKKDGNVFDSSLERDPLEFTVGKGQVIVGFENAVVGMEIDQKKKVEIPVEEAYGQKIDSLVGQVNREQLPENITPEVGLELMSQTQDGQEIIMRIIDFDDETLTLDANHPLAGHDLEFEIQLVEIL